MYVCLYVYLKRNLPPSPPPTPLLGGNNENTEEFCLHIPCPRTGRMINFFSQSIYGAKILYYFLSRSLVILQLPCYTIADFCFAMARG